MSTVGSVLYDADLAIFRALNWAGINPVLDAAMVFFTTLGAAYVIVLVAIPIWLTGRRSLAIDVLLILLIVTVVTEAIKFATLVPRPCETLGDVRLLRPDDCAGLDPAFPSAHASRAFAVAVVIAVAYTRRIWIAGFVVAGLIGLSRIYLGLHWPSDVLAGALLGATLALAFVWAAQRSPRYRAARTRIVVWVQGLARGARST